MARHARIKAMESWAVFYYLYCRAGKEGEYPLKLKEARYRMLSLLKSYQTVYQMRVTGFCIMGIYYHQMAEFAEYREMIRDEPYAPATGRGEEMMLREQRGVGLNRFLPRDMTMSVKA